MSQSISLKTFLINMPFLDIGLPDNTFLIQFWDQSVDSIVPDRASVCLMVLCPGWISNWSPFPADFPKTKTAQPFKRSPKQKEVLNPQAVFCLQGSKPQNFRVNCFKFQKFLEKSELSRNLVEHLIQFNNFFWFHSARHTQSSFNRELQHHLRHFLFFCFQFFWSLARIFVSWT